MPHINTTATSTTWVMWNGANDTTGSTVANGNTWYVWVSGATNTATTWTQAAPLTDEQRAEFAQHERERRAEEIAARERAEELLLAHLNADQRAEYRRDRSFRLIVSDKTYRIERGRAGNVHLLDENGEPEIRYCIHPAEYVPDEDTILAQKLLLETDERAFLRIANATPLRRAG